jgi:hypothetical protein
MGTSEKTKKERMVASMNKNKNVFKFELTMDNLSQEQINAVSDTIFKDFLTQATAMGLEINGSVSLMLWSGEQYEEFTTIFDNRRNLEEINAHAEAEMAKAIADQVLEEYDDESLE